MTVCLSSEQRAIAEQNHNLIYSYLHKRHLAHDDYYDLCAIGLCKAAYIFDPSLGNQFSTLAFACMESEVRHYWNHNSGNTVIPEYMIVSLQDPVPNDGKESASTFMDIIQDSFLDPEHDQFLLDLKLFYETLPLREKKVFTLRACGLTFRQVGEHLNLSHEWIRKIVKDMEKKYRWWRMA